jgi:AcrR family transcriptional regulator
MSEKGVDSATMLEIAELADVGAGTVYNYFKSKEELAFAVLEDIMANLAVRIEKVTNTFADPAQVYAFGIRTVLDTATHDERWTQLLNRSEVMADAMYRQIGPYAIRDLRQAVEAGRFFIDDPQLVWRLTTHTIVGAAFAITSGLLNAESKTEIIVRLLCMTGIGLDAAIDLANRPRPRLK